MVAVLVCHHVRLGKLAALRAELIGERVVEAQVDVHLAIGRAIEGAHCGRGVAARGRDLAVEQDGVGPLVSINRARPVLLHGVHHRDQRAVALLVRVGTRLTAFDGSAIAGALEPNARTRAPAVEPAEQEDDENDDADQPAPADCGSGTETAGEAHRPTPSV